MLEDGEKQWLSPVVSSPGLIGVVCGVVDAMPPVVAAAIVDIAHSMYDVAVDVMLLSAGFWVFVGSTPLSMSAAALTIIFTK